MKSKEHQLIIFVRNPVLGKVKTRLAKTIGAKKALEVYTSLLDYTHSVTLSVNADKVVLYSDFIDDNDLWDNQIYKKYVQEGKGLGERMQNAFQLIFNEGYKKVVIIGSDCMELTPEIIDNAFTLLNKYDAVLGPAKDGGYYLLGMNKLYKKLFKNKVWSTENVFLDTLLDLKNLNLSYHFLETLSDVDCEDDLKTIRMTKNIF